MGSSDFTYPSLDNWDLCENNLFFRPRVVFGKATNLGFEWGENMIVDIQDWGLGTYRAWGFFNVPSHLIQVDVKALFSYCTNLDSRSITIVFISTGQLASINHAFLASYFAAKAISSKRNLAKDLGMEVLLYLSGQNQIYAAITMSGISDQQKTNEEMWAVVFFSTSTERLLTEKRKMETYFKISLFDAIQDVQPSLLQEGFTLNHKIRADHLAVLEKMAQPIPRLPVAPASSQEMALLQGLIEKMVILSLEEIKSE